MIEIRTFGPTPVPAPGAFTRADLEFYRINHFKPSYVAWLFFNDPELDAENASPGRASFAGSFAIFGHGNCSGDEGHCDVHTHLRRFDDRPTHPLTRAFKRVVVTDALQRCITDSELTVKIVAQSDPADGDPHGGVLLDFEGMQLATFAMPSHG